VKLLTIPQVAERLQVSPQRAYEMARAGLLPAVRLGRQVRVSEEALEDWIRKGGKALPGGWRREAS